MYIKNSSYRISFPHPPTLPHPHPHTHAHTFCQGKPGDDGDQGAFGDVVSTAFTTGIFELPVIILSPMSPSAGSQGHPGPPGAAGPQGPPGARVST